MFIIAAIFSLVLPALRAVYLAGILLVAAVIAADASYITAITLLIDTLAPIGLKFLPAGLDGQKMAAIALGISAVLGLGDLYATGQLQHFQLLTFAGTLLAYIGATQGFYALFKDPWKLQDPPTANGPVMPSLTPPPKVV